MPNYWFDHIHLISTDPHKTAEFYEKMFGAKKVGVREATGGRIAVDLDLNGAKILIIQPKAEQMVPSATQTGLEHFGLRTDNLEAAVTELKAEGVNFIQDITVSRPGVKISFFLAPENVLIELLQRSE